MALSYQREWDSRDENAITRELLYLIEDIVQNEVSRCRISNDEARVVMRYAEESRYDILTLFFRQFRNIPDFVHIEDMTRFVDQIYDKIWDNAADIIRRMEDEQRRRDRRYDRRDDRLDRGSARRNDRLNRTNFDLSSGYNAAGINSGRKVDTAETDNERRSRLAAEGSKRERDKDQRQATNQPEQKVSPPTDPHAHNLDQPGITYTQNYAVIANRDPAKSTLVGLEYTEDVPQPINNNLYTIRKTGSALIDNATQVAIRDLVVKSPCLNFNNALGLITHNDPTFFNPERWCYFIDYHRLKLHNTPGIGMEILKAGEEVKEVFAKKDEAPRAKLVNLEAAMNKYRTNVRGIFYWYLTSAWNTTAQTCLALPGDPSDFLAAKSITDILGWYPESRAEKDERLLRKIRNVASASKTAYVDRLDRIADNIFGNLFEDSDCGVVNVPNHEKAPTFLSMFDQLPFVISRYKRSRDLVSMNDDEKKQLVNQTAKDYALFIEKRSVIMTNLSIDDIWAERPITCISATDADVPQLFRTILEPEKNYEFVWLNTKKQKWQHVGQIGKNGDNDLIFSTFKG